MAARLLQPRVVAPWVVAALASGAILPSVALAEAPPQDSSDSSKKPIYDDDDIYAPLTTKSTASPRPSPFSDTIPASARPYPSPSATTSSYFPSTSTSTSNRDSAPSTPTPTDRLAVQIGRARLSLHAQVSAAEDALNAAMDGAFHLEQSFTSTLASLAPPRASGETLMPGLVYVLVAGMSGSIVASRRGFLLRGLTPLAFGVGAAWLVLPVTMRNVSELAWTYEKRVPAVADAHVQAKQAVQDTWKGAREAAEGSRRTVEGKMAEAREVMEGWVSRGK